MGVCGTGLRTVAVARRVTGMADGTRMPGMSDVGGKVPGMFDSIAGLAHLARVPDMVPAVPDMASVPKATAAVAEVPDPVAGMAAMRARPVGAQHGHPGQAGTAQGEREPIQVGHRRLDQS